MTSNESKLLTYLYHRFPLTPEDAMFIGNVVSSIVKEAKETKRKKSEEKYTPAPEELSEFERARDLYKSLFSKAGMRASEIMFQEFRKKHKKWKEYLPLLCSSILSQSAFRENQKLKGEFVPFPKNFKTWLNQRCWEEQVEEIQESKPAFKSEVYY